MSLNLIKIANDSIISSYPNGWKVDEFDSTPLYENGFTPVGIDTDTWYNKDGDKIEFFIYPAITGGLSISYRIEPSKKFNEGDVVYCTYHDGVGIVERVSDHPDITYKVIVKFANGFSETYTLDGREKESNLPVLKKI